ncbi:MAG TPA: hypothetical protein VGM92_12190 [Candidatus Kapabacteria bacterium]|jgi:hypothetical protein
MRFATKTFATLAFAIFLLLSTIAQSQNRTTDTSFATKTSLANPTDSTSQALDSAYRARKAVLDAWVRSERSAARPQSDFISAFMNYGGYLRVLPRDINQLFSERTERSDPSSDRDQYSTVDRAFMFGGQAQLATTWGIYFEYDLTMKWFNTQIGDNGPTEEIDFTQHSLVVGGMYVFYSGPFYRLRVNGGIGAAFGLTSETETGGYSRSASASGLAVNFDINNDFRVYQGLSFTLDFLTRSITTGTLTTSSGQTLDAPFGKANPNAITLQPTASSIAFGVAAGLVFYF